MVLPLAPVLLPNPHEASSEMLSPPLVIPPTQLPPAVLPANMLLVTVTVLSTQLPPTQVLSMPAPPGGGKNGEASAELPENVLLMTVALPKFSIAPPLPLNSSPLSVAELSENVLLVTVIVLAVVGSLSVGPKFTIAPPVLTAELPEKLQLLTVSESLEN
jgi:hypothetical protein